MGDMADYQIEQGMINDAIGEDMDYYCTCGEEAVTNGGYCMDCFNARNEF